MRFAADQSACEANLRLSLDAYAAALQADFAACVNAVVDDDWTMSLGTAPCLGEGCLQDAVLHISCSVDPVEFGVTGESPQPCYEAPHQPPPFFESTCDIGEGEVTITSGIETWSTSITSGSTSYRNFFCEDSGCSVVLDGLALSVDDFAVGDYVLHHVEVSLHTPAIGYMDGQVVTFPAGAIRIDIAAGTRWEGAGTPPFGYDPRSPTRPATRNPPRPQSPTAGSSSIRWSSDTTDTVSRSSWSPRLVIRRCHSPGFGLDTPTTSRQSVG
ncbi:hypothetical protein OV079_45040 [Nannocystis pusilla]|uniref:Uncharacterized protein n=1 Tax=Nannocystis pusilla TaxID=889268 RepID=A0A9X3J1A8_9BACT|nr:hypothetical protein [Nannocystis pusilla]MCY1012582.1 hypothetical protein [Nannocystis pusilla]